MQLLYDAANTVEAHMILNLLEQAGLSAKIEGEYLQGGVGEIQAMGIVRVMVDERDYAEAKAIIDAWDKKQPEIEAPAAVVKKQASISSAIVGFIFGVAAVLVYINTPIKTDGIDYDGDGVLDEKWIFINGSISKSEIDRNLDGEVDYVFRFNRLGDIESVSADDDFNGTFETDLHYKYGNAIWQKSDTTGDGFKDYRMDFKNGLVDTISFLSPESKKIIKVQSFGAFKLKSASVDTDNDGVLDTSHEYDAIEEVVESVTTSERKQ